MSDTASPVPGIGEALDPWIHSRQETRRIRRAISHHLSSYSQGGQDHEPLLDHASPSVILDSNQEPPDGLYRRYYDALRANVAARENYERVKQELEELRSERAAELGKRKGVADRASVQDYIARQGQRRQHARLNIIQETLAKLTEQAPRALHDDVGALVRAEAGEPPDAPKTSLRAAAMDERAVELCFRLKRELLLAKQAADKKPAHLLDGHTNGNGVEVVQPSLAAQVQALRVARDHLISWIESELAKISEEEGDSSMLEGDATGGAATEGSRSQTTLPSDQDMQRHVQSLYDEYVTARQRLVCNIDAVIDSAKDSPDGTSSGGRATSVSNRSRGHESHSSTSNSNNNITYTDLMTVAPILVHTAATERALVQQASYLRRQLKSVSEETKATVQRLAGESYLVPPDAVGMKAWAAAAAAKGEDTNAHVQGQLSVAQAAVDATAERLSIVGRRNKALSALDGGL